MESSRSGSATNASASQYSQSVGGGKTADYRRLSEPSNLGHTLAHGENGGGCAPLPHCQNAQGRGVGPQHLQFDHSQQLRQQQPHTNDEMNHHKNSYAGAIDLMTSSVIRTNANHHAATHGNLFISSSHHTAHAHGAGDLLSMTRRTLDLSASAPNAQLTTKKRSLTTQSTTSDDGMALGIGSQQMQNQQELPMQRRQTPEHHYFGQSSNTKIGHDNNCGSTQVQTKRRCRRDESFEMDDGR